MLSFILSAVSIFILIIFKENIVKYIYLFKTLDTMRTLFYAVPYELIVIGSNTNKSMSSYLANLNILENSRYSQINNGLFRTCRLIYGLLPC